MIEDDIRANRRKIFTGRVFFLCYVALYTCAFFAPLGYVFFGAAGMAGLIVILASLTLWVSLLFYVCYFNEEIVCRAAGAFPLQEGGYPRLRGAAEDLAIASGRTAPRLMLVDDDAVNAFSMRSVRRRRDVTFCTEGMARDLHTDETRAVMAHEMAHLGNGDAEIGSLIMPFNAITSYAYRHSPKKPADLPGALKLALALLAVIILMPLLLTLVLYNPWSAVSGDFFAIMLAGLILPPFSLYLVGTMLSFYWGFTLAKREFLADETAIEWTRHPEGLIDALIKAGSRNMRPGFAFLDNACFAPPGGTRGVVDFQPSIGVRIDNIRKETHLPPA